MSGSVGKSPRVIISFDLNSFYASVAVRDDPSLAGLPVGIVQKHLVVTCNYLARARGCGKLMPTDRALAACPELRLVDGSDLTPFRRAAAHVREVVRARLPSGTPMEWLGLDEIFVDATRAVTTLCETAARPPQILGHVRGVVHEADNFKALSFGAGLAAELRAAVKDSTGLNMSAGIGESKLAAKLAGGLHKPDDQTTFVTSKAVGEHLAYLSPRAVPGFGRAYWTKLQAGHPEILTVTEMLKYFSGGNKGKLAEVLGSSDDYASWFLDACRGVDKSDVVTSGPPKVIGAEDSMRNCNNRALLQEKLLELSQRLVSRVIEDSHEYGPRSPSSLTVKYRIRGTGFKPTQRAVPMPASVLAPGLRSIGDRAACARTTAEKQVVEAALRVIGENVPLSDLFCFTLLGLGATRFSAVRSPRKSVSEAFSSVGQAKRRKRALSSTVCPVCNRILPPSISEVAVRRHVDDCITSQSEKGSQPQLKKKKCTSGRVDLYFSNSKSKL